jgi:proteasome lid subunit RPN8/RPN11
VKPLEFARGLWPALMDDLRRRGRGIRESGAFLLGRRTERVRRVDQWIAYEELDPESLHFKYVRLETSAFSRLWRHCEEVGLEVVADVHTHPLGSMQSPSDRSNPMIATAGHVALIVPTFAQGEVRPKDLSFNVYLGAKLWKNLYREQAAEFIRIVE